jgi:ribosomal protein L28
MGSTRLEVGAHRTLSLRLASRRERRFEVAIRKETVILRLDRQCTLNVSARGGSLAGSAPASSR